MTEGCLISDFCLKKKRGWTKWALRPSTAAYLSRFPSSLLHQPWPLQSIRTNALSLRPTTIPKTPYKVKNQHNYRLNTEETHGGCRGCWDPATALGGWAPLLSHGPRQTGRRRPHSGVRFHRPARSRRQEQLLPHPLRETPSPTACISLSSPLYQFLLCTGGHQGPREQAT